MNKVAEGQRREKIFPFIPLASAGMGGCELAVAGGCAACLALQTTMAAASAAASLKQRGCVWAECSYSRRSLTSQDAAKYLLWKCWSQGFSLHLRAVSRQVILGAYQLPSCPSHQEWAGIFQVLISELVRRWQAWYCNRLIRRGWCWVPGGMIPGDPQRMTPNTVVCGFKTEPFLQYF